MSDNIPISEKYLRAAHHWADLENGASIMEESKSSVLSQMLMKHTNVAHNKAEMLVKASPEWQDYIKRMCNARALANHAKVELEYLRMLHREWVSADANNRMQARL